MLNTHRHIFQIDTPYSSIHDITLNDALTRHAAAAVSHVLAHPNVTANYWSLRFLRKRANVVAGSWRGAFGWGQKVSAACVASARLSHVATNFFLQPVLSAVLNSTVRPEVLLCPPSAPAAAELMGG